MPPKHHAPRDANRGGYRRAYGDIPTRTSTEINGEAHSHETQDTGAHTERQRHGYSHAQTDRQPDTTRHANTGEDATHTSDNNDDDKQTGRRANTGTGRKKDNKRVSVMIYTKKSKRHGMYILHDHHGAPPPKKRHPGLSSSCSERRALQRRCHPTPTAGGRI